MNIHFAGDTVPSDSLWPQSWSQAVSQWSSHKSRHNDVILYENHCPLKVQIWKLFFKDDWGSDPIYTFILIRYRLLMQSFNETRHMKYHNRLLRSGFKVCFLTVQSNVCTGQAPTWHGCSNSKTVSLHFFLPLSLSLSSHRPASPTFSPPLSGRELNTMMGVESRSEQVMVWNPPRLVNNGGDSRLDLVAGGEEEWLETLTLTWATLSWKLDWSECFSSHFFLLDFFLLLLSFSACCFKLSAHQALLYMKATRKGWEISNRDNRIRSTLWCLGRH